MELSYPSQYLGEQDPRKQGLKRIVARARLTETPLGEQDPRKQGLKRKTDDRQNCNCTTRRARSKKTRIETDKAWRKLEKGFGSESKIQENKDWNTVVLESSNEAYTRRARSKKTRIETPSVDHDILLELTRRARSKKTRIETRSIFWYIEYQETRRARSKKTRIETIFYLTHPLCLPDSESKIQENKDWNPIRGQGVEDQLSSESKIQENKDWNFALRRGNWDGD